ncbi:SDR family NAD(P)-dependent oxidoreductase [Synechococcus sp. 1G10]|uniref:SDR family NAD(P)-dependent oxidoreductase n=1 Tax=Synechococcus sp. 1G10 TaxID=2025605 RepID=UPI000B9869EC|nr:SDR family NAD(P)-dependent oxidoreductase [Synechococcus sp. 1G10]
MSQIDQLPAGVVVVTGASRGLGRELVNQLRQRGRPVIAVVRRIESCTLPADDDDLQLVEADLSTPAGIEAAIEGIELALGARSIAALVNGAGAVTPVGPLVAHSSNAMTAALTLMAIAPARLSVALAQRMLPAVRVLNLSTRSAHETFPGLSLYCMSKHALHSVSRSLQLECSATMAVAELIPGEVDTDMQADLRTPDPADFEMAAFFRMNQPNLIPTELAVAFIAWVLLDTLPEDYARTDPWYVYDASIHHEWVPQGMVFNYPEP